MPEFNVDEVLKALPRVRTIESGDGLRLQVLRLTIENFNLRYQAVQAELVQAEQRLLNQKNALDAEFKERYGVTLEAIRPEGDSWEYDEPHTAKERDE